MHRAAARSVAGLSPLPGIWYFEVIPDGRLVAYRADTGEKLLDLKTGLHRRHGSADHIHARRQAVHLFHGRHG
jgi:hypothetical protein